MFLNVLVGVDGSSSGRDAIALASRLLALADSHARSRAAPAPSAAAGPFGGGADDAREASRRLLVRERASAEVATELVSIRDLAPGRGLHVQAEQREADLLVVGSCARAVAGRTMLADDTRAALNGAPCPVAIACCGYARATRPIRTVGVAYNRSRESDAALIMAREIAAATGAAVRALEVVPVMGHGFRAFVPASADERVDAMLQEAGEHMDGLLDVDGRVCYGLVGEELAAFARESTSSWWERAATGLAAGRWSGTPRTTLSAARDARCSCSRGPCRQPRRPRGHRRRAGVRQPGAQANADGCPAREMTPPLSQTRGAAYGASGTRSRPADRGR